MQVAATPLAFQMPVDVQPPVLQLRLQSTLALLMVSYQQIQPPSAWDKVLLFQVQEEQALPTIGQAPMVEPTGIYSLSNMEGNPVSITHQRKREHFAFIYATKMLVGSAGIPATAPLIRM